MKEKNNRLIPMFFYLIKKAYFQKLLLFIRMMAFQKKLANSVKTCQVFLRTDILFQKYPEHDKVEQGAALDEFCYLNPQCQVLFQDPFAGFLESCKE